MEIKLRRMSREQSTSVDLQGKADTVADRAAIDSIGMTIDHGS